MCTWNTQRTNVNDLGSIVDHINRALAHWDTIGLQDIMTNEDDPGDGIRTIGRNDHLVGAATRPKQGYAVGLLIHNR